MVKVMVANLSAMCEQDKALEVAADLRAQFGEGAPMPTFEFNAAPVKPQFSEFGAGKQIVDTAAATRIQGLQDKLTAAGVTVNASEQLYDTGTRMAEDGYATQRGREQAFRKQRPAADAIDELHELIVSERREDVEITARQLASRITPIQGGAAFCGLQLREQAIRGLAMRLESPMLSYAVGLLRRAAEGDEQKLANVIAYECEKAPEVTLKLRCRKGVQDVFAVVSPSYTPADFTQVSRDLLAAIPDGAKGSFKYDAAKTDWNIRLDVWTPTPVDEQAVGEPFDGYVNLHGRDNGTGPLGGGGGAEFLRCLNASVYAAVSAEVHRVHRSNVLVNFDELIARSAVAIRTLCEAWGINRQVEIPTPEGLAWSRELNAMMFRGLLTDRKSQLVGVLPGRTETHVEALSLAFDSERRNPDKLVRADVAQAWTRYSQAFEPAVQYEAQTAIGSWLVESTRPIAFVEK